MSLPTVALVTEHWGDRPSEEATITRLLGGALARSARVEILHLGAAVHRPVTRRDSVFTLHELPLQGDQSLRGATLRAALGRGGQALSPTLERFADSYSGWCAGVAERLGALSPDAVVLAGHAQPWDHAALAGPGAPPVTFLPYLGDLGRATERGIADLISVASRIATINVAEHAALSRAYPDRRDDLVALDPALPLNRSATAQLLFGVHWFGTYVLLIRSFPPDSHRYKRVITRELLSSILGVSVAEVDGERFTISDRDNAVVLPVNPTRVNLWRLMAHAEVTIDARPPGPFGQEAIESMLLGTPVVVPAGSAAHAVALEAGGGLGYLEAGDLLDASRELLAPGESQRRGEAGRRWAETVHGDTAGFVRRAAEIVLGGDPAQVAASSSAAMPSRMSDSE